MKSQGSSILALCLSVALLIPAFQATAQSAKGDTDKREQIDAMRIAFITQQLSLTREEAQKFWPVYNEYRETLGKLRKERHDEFKKYRDNFSALSESEMTEYVDKQIIYRQRELDVMKKYHAEFKSILPIHKVAQLYRAEEEFKAKILKEAQQRKAY